MGRSHTYMTIVGLDLCPPSDATERVPLYHRAYTRITPISLDIYEDNTHIKLSIGHTNNTGTHMCIFVRIVGLSITFMVECMFFLLHHRYHPPPPKKKKKKKKKK